MTTTAPAPLRIEAQPGPQVAFQKSPADIAIYGGAAGGGKSWALLMEPLRHIDNGGFDSVFFRRTTVQIRNPGGLWDESLKVYPLADGEPTAHVLEWKFPSGAKIKLSHLEHDKSVLDWQGAQIPLLCFDELTHFTASQFWYMVSRNRSLCGVRPYIRATCNPDADSWVAELIGWWIDPETGLPIPERGGVIRWYARIGETLKWGDSAAELRVTYPDSKPKSLTFIPALLSDNKALTEADPEYQANLESLPKVERERLLGGNWKIRAAAGLLFQRTWCQVVDALPIGLSIKRGWDLAATPKIEGNDPDWTSGTKIGRSQDGRYFVLDSRKTRESPAGVTRFLRNTASADGMEVEHSLPQDPGQAGKSQAAALIGALEGYTVRATPETGDKVTRFGPFSAQAEAGNVYILRGDWNEEWFSALEAFPEATHDDDADSTSRAFNAFLPQGGGAGFMEFARQQMVSDAAAKEPALIANGSRLRFPPGTTVIDMNGSTHYAPGEDGTFVAKPEHVAQLRGIGCTDA